MTEDSKHRTTSTLGTIPLAEERVDIGKTVRTTGRLRVRKLVRVAEEPVEAPLLREEVSVERVSVGRWIDRAPPVREEGDTTVIPVVEEVAVVEKRLRLVEEIRVTRTRHEDRFHDRVAVRREEAVVERLPPEANPEHPQPDQPHRRHHMTTTVIALFDDHDAAMKARQSLSQAGTREEGIRVFGGERAQEDVQKVHQLLTEHGVHKEDAEAFTQALGRGAILLTADVEDQEADNAIELLDQHGALGVDETSDEDAGQRSEGRERQTRSIPEVEEDVEIGKRKVQQGGVRVHRTVTERPVEKTVSLKEENIDVNRRKADRDLKPEEAQEAFEESTTEFKESREEPETRKAARMIGEVEVTKSTEEHEEQVKETARKSEVEVERVDAGKAKGRNENRKK